jgi:hypothetical protein
MSLPRISVILGCDRNEALNLASDMAAIVPYKDCSLTAVLADTHKDLFTTKKPLLIITHLPTTTDQVVGLWNWMSRKYILAEHQYNPRLLKKDTIEHPSLIFLALSDEIPQAFKESGIEFEVFKCKQTERALDIRIITGTNQKKMRAEAKRLARIEGCFKTISKKDMIKDSNNSLLETPANALIIKGLPLIETRLKKLNALKYAPTINKWTYMAMPTLIFVVAEDHRGIPLQWESSELSIQVIPT